MNRKIYLWGIATIIALFFASCSQTEPENLSNEAEVTFTLDIENAIATRAISDGTGANQITFAIFNEDGSEIFTPKTSRTISGNQLLNGVEIKATLVKGNTYKACFWAQNSKCTAYSISEDMKVTINYEGLNNDETRDAFFAYTEPFTVDVNPRLRVILKRPFAQINVGSTKDDIDAITASGVKVSKSEAIIEDIPSELNLFNGNTDKPVNVNYALAAMPKEKLYVDTDGDSIKEEFTYLSMSYVLADTLSSTHKMKFNFPDDNSTEVIEMATGLETVPAKRNWRTNILGNILSGDIQFRIKIDPQYEGDININNGAYYNFSEETTIENCTFVFDNNDTLATFASTGGQLLTFRNVTFTGYIGAISFGEYRMGYDGSRFNYNNYLENVILTNFTNNYYIVDAGNKVAPSIVVYGNSTLKNCTMTGSKTLAPAEYYCADLGITARTNALIDGGVYENAYLWAQSKTTIQGAKFKKIVAGVLNHTNTNLVIKAGTEIDTLRIAWSGFSTYSPKFTIEAGAKINVLDYTGTVSTNRTNVSIAEGTATTIIENH
ncbi:MAG: hypothetical protein IKY67_04040 [Paludibacteraceae bacterium]|nr:hypothetical protein [Paludibacteraceae bacterium]